MFNTYLQLIFRYPKSKKYFPILILLMLLNVLFETLSLAAFYPFLMSILGDYNEFLKNFPNVSKIISFISLTFFENLEPPKSIIISSLIIVIILFIIKFLFFLLFSLFQYYFLFDMRKTFSNIMFKKYLVEDYYSILKKGSAVIQKDFLELIDYAITAITALTNLIVEILILVSIVIILLTINFKFTSFAFFIMFVFSTSIYMVFKNKYHIWGEKRERLVSKKINTILEAFNAKKK